MSIFLKNKLILLKCYAWQHGGSYRSKRLVMKLLQYQNHHGSELRIVFQFQFNLDLELRNRTELVPIQQFRTVSSELVRSSLLGCKNRSIRWKWSITIILVTFSKFKIIFLHIMKIFIEVVEQNSERLVEPKGSHYLCVPRSRPSHRRRLSFRQIGFSAWWTNI